MPLKLFVVFFLAIFLLSQQLSWKIKFEHRTIVLSMVKVPNWSPIESGQELSEHIEESHLFPRGNIRWPKTCTFVQFLWFLNKSKTKFSHMKGGNVVCCAILFCSSHMQSLFSDPFTIFNTDWRFPLLENQYLERTLK